MSMFNVKSRKSQNRMDYIDFDTSDPNICYLGGGSSGGTVVQSTSPAAAMQAGQLGADAATEAANIYSGDINNAIQALNNQYNQAQYAVQPYQQAGVQALDQLNQYLGLSAYNPGSAPVNPNTWNPTQQDIQNYVNQNSHVQLAGKDNNVYTDYTGVGSAYDGWSRTQEVNGQPTGADLIGYDGQATVNAAQNQDITNLLKQQYVQQNMPQYTTNLENYNSNLNNYNKYTAEGPLTQKQITDNITNQPGYQAQLNQGINAINSSSSASGALGSGQQLKELMNFGQNTLSQYYGATLQQLAGLVNAGSRTAESLSQASQAQGNSLASLYNSLGTNQANAILSGANSQSQGLIAANQQYNVMGGSNGGLSGIGSLLSGGASLLGSAGSASSAGSGLLGLFGA